ncbi:uncharacterized protein LOC120336968 isoform X1 [Styela clava]
MPGTVGRRTLVKVEVGDAEKRRIPSKHYSYVIKVWWDDDSETVVYRRYSKFFEFQIILLETFPYEGGLKEPSARIIPFLPGKILFRRSHVRDVAMKRLKPIDEYCKALIKLPSHISKCNHVLDFFETRQEDLNPSREEGSRRRKRDDQGNRSLSLSRSLRGIRRSQSLNKEIGEISGPLLLEQYVAIADYNSTQQKELTMTIGQKVEVIEKNENGWWFVSNDEGERGWVPGVYLEKPDGTVEDLVTNRAEPGQGEHYVTTNAYVAENSDDISFGAGVIVEVLQKNLEGWWLVSYNGRQGNAPASYLEKSHNWVPENNKVEIISSIHDLKHRHSLPANSLSSIAFPSQRIVNFSSSNSKPIPAEVHSIPEEPKSPVSPSYFKEKTVQPPPKRSSVKRTNKRRPMAPPPLPPSAAAEPTYEYTTVASFDSNIPDGISFKDDKKVEVLEKSPGGWWYVNIDGSEGWAPASYIEKKETKPKTIVPPSRPGPPKLLKNNSTNSFSITAAGRSSPVHKVQSSDTVNHPVLGKVASIPILRNQSSMSPAKRPLPPLPTSVSSSNVQDCSDTYEEVATRPLSENIKFGASKSIPPAVPKSTAKPNLNKTAIESQKVETTPVDFRSVLKSSLAKKNEIKTRSAQSPPRPSTNPSPLSNVMKPKIQPNNINLRPKTTTSTQKPSNVRNSVTRMNSNETSSAVNNLKPVFGGKTAEGPPRLPPKPKPGLNFVKAKPVQGNVPTDDDAITDFRSVLRSTQRKQSASTNGVGRSKSFTSDKVIGMKKVEQGNKPPFVPKKPANMPLKPPVPTKMKELDEFSGGEENNPKAPGKRNTKTTRPPWNSGPGTKPVLRRFQTNNNSNVDEVQKKPVFTVGHLKIELKNPPDLTKSLPKRGSPDGQVDCKFEDTSKSNTITPPTRTKKILKSKHNPKNSKSVSKTNLQKTESNDSSSNFCIAMSDYTGIEECEISFQSGDRAELLEKGDNDWWYIKIGENVGWAPSTYFKLPCEEESSEKDYVAVDGSSNAKSDQESFYNKIEPERPSFPSKFVAVADFEADNHSMVSLHAGDEVTITQEASGGWWYAILSNGNGEGWVPSSYLDPVE